MAEDFDQSRTEAPTQRRRDEAREQGQVAVSPELTSGILLLAGVLALWLGAPALGQGIRQMAERNFLSLEVRDLDLMQAQSILTGLLGRSGQMLTVFFAVLVTAAAGIGALQVGVRVVPGLVAPRWEKISPSEGWSRMFSRAALVRGLVAVAKVALIASVAYWMLARRTGEITMLGEDVPSAASAQGWNLAIRLALAIAAALAVVGLADYVYQRVRFEQSLRMTRQELKEELRREEGDPQMRARIRKMQREMSRRRMMQEIPKATIVITNPTHLAVALRYDRATMAAPRVVAKGVGVVAQRIVELARRHAVPVVEKQPLAQALYRAVQLGQEIPAALYQAVAEVLAYIMRLRGTA